MPQLITVPGPIFLLDYRYDGEAFEMKKSFFQVKAEQLFMPPGWDLGATKMRPVAKMTVDWSQLFCILRSCEFGKSQETFDFAIKAVRSAVSLCRVRGDPLLMCFAQSREILDIAVRSAVYSLLPICQEWKYNWTPYNFAWMLSNFEYYGTLRQILQRMTRATGKKVWVPFPYHYSDTYVQVTPNRRDELALTEFLNGK